MWPVSASRALQQRYTPHTIYKNIPNIGVWNARDVSILCEVHYTTFCLDNPLRNSYTLDTWLWRTGWEGTAASTVGLVRKTAATCVCRRPVCRLRFPIRQPESTVVHARAQYKNNNEHYHNGSNNNYYDNRRCSRGASPSLVRHRVNRLRSTPSSRRPEMLIRSLKPLARSPLHRISAVFTHTLTTV